MSSQDKMKEPLIIHEIPDYIGPREYIDPSVYDTKGIMADIDAALKVPCVSEHFPYKSEIEELVDTSRMAYGCLVLYGDLTPNQWEVVHHHAVKIRRLTLKALIELDKKKGKPKPRPKPGGPYGKQEA